jgi:hypothetical protein
MVSNLIKIGICATSFVVIGSLGQHPLLAQPYLTNSNPDQSEVTEDVTESETTDSPELNIEQFVGRSAAHVSTYTEPYSNAFTENSSASPRKRKIPEPSAVIGLMAIAGWLGMQRKIKKG